MDQLDPAILAQTPALKPPPGVIPNFKNPYNEGPVMVIVGSICTVLVVFFVLARVYTASRLNRSFGVDEYVFIMAGVLGFTFAIVTMQVTRYGIGKHQWDVPIITFTPKLMKLLFSSEMLYGPSMIFSKYALFLLYLRVFKPLRIMRILIYLGMLYTFGLYISNIVVNSVACAPHPGEAWLDPELAKRCGSQTLYAPLQGGLSVLLDFYLLTLPYPALMRLNMAKKKKRGIMVIFAVGLLACITSILGLIYRIALYRSEDSTYNTNRVNVLTICEIDMAIICASMPAFASFFRHVKSKASSLGLLSSLSSLRHSSSAQKGGKISSNTGSSSFDRPHLGPSSLEKVHLPPNARAVKISDHYLELHDDVDLHAPPDGIHTTRSMYQYV